MPASRLGPDLVGFQGRRLECRFVVDWMAGVVVSS